LYPADKKGDEDDAARMKEAAAHDSSLAPTKTPFAPPHAPPSSASSNHILTEDELAALEDGGAVGARAGAGKRAAAAAGVGSALGVTPGAPEMKEEEVQVQGGLAFSTGAGGRGTGTGRQSVPAVPVREEDVEMTKGGTARHLPGLGAEAEPGAAGGSVVGYVPAVTAMPMDSTSLSHLASGGDTGNQNIVQSNANKVRQFHPACAAAAQLEVRLAMSTLFHTFYRGIESPSRLWDGNGTCKVQLLRSIGKWSTGTKEEISIQNCYIDTINNAKHFVYIENQFFVSNTAGPDVTNGIATALINRIIAAHAAGEPFRVIVIIPVHPNGDFAAAKKAQCVMHFEYATINRGVSCMFAELRRRAPNITISNYIGFYSLRNWGVINNKVVSDQVYVHDKLLIVDDRVMVIGSANINDRSMLGERDSELAIRIEDTLHCNIKMNEQPFVVGFMPHTVRTRLMRQHLGEHAEFGTL
jgi:hypothetical protein